ncbi:hypothetical protein BV898_01182 [Hypsibius exemplaris]|uniref:Uncharacterized protein n=1 Tax=Hypsibius exemplaris TaxID=2072580 RepID=A0A1W0XBT8_HYPEX|nr:hypothetical protein BV898_01182 [Hypsibius exemplaris]
MVTTATLPWLQSNFYDRRATCRPYTGHDLRRAYPQPEEPPSRALVNPVLQHTREVERIRAERNKRNGESVVAGTCGNFPCHGGLKTNRVDYYITPPVRRDPLAGVREGSSSSNMAGREKTYLPALSKQSSRRIVGYTYEPPTVVIKL